MALLTGLTEDNREVPVQVDATGRLVAEGLTGPAGPAGSIGPAGPAGPQGDSVWAKIGDDVSYTPGRVLVGTSTARTNMFNTPSSYGATLQVEGTTYNSSSASIITNSTIDNPVLFLARSKGTAIGSNTIVSSGDCVGEVQFQANDGSEFVELAAIQAYVDGTPGANDMPGRLSFSTCGDGASSPTERMRINRVGEILFGSATTTAPSFFFTPGSDGGALVKDTDSTNARTHIVFRINGTQVGSITTSGSATAYNTSSDYRLKEHVTAVTDGISRLQQLKPSRFNFIVDPDKTVDGFIAHEVYSVVPEAIHGAKDEVDADGNPVYQGIDQSKLVPLLTAALQEAIGEIESLKARVVALESA